MLAARKGIKQNGLRQGDKRRAEPALQNPVHNKTFERIRLSAEYRGDEETKHAIEHDLAPAELRRQPPGQRRHHGGGENVEGHHPADLVRRRRKRALHLRQNDTDDQNRHSIQGRRHRDGSKKHPAPEGTGRPVGMLGNNHEACD